MDITLQKRERRPITDLRHTSVVFIWYDEVKDAFERFLRTHRGSSGALQHPPDVVQDSESQKSEILGGGNMGKYFQVE